MVQVATVGVTCGQGFGAEMSMRYLALRLKMNQQKGFKVTVWCLVMNNS